MPDFTHVFPAETVTDIFSYLDQKECIECMEVCRRWYDLIPSFTTRVWHQLKVSSSSAGYDNDGNAISCCWLQSNIALLQCLGPHVKDVSICFQDTRSVLERLYTQRCEIKCLEINNHKPTLKRNKRPTTNDSIRLPVVITLFAPTLTQLSITSHPCDVSLTMLLDTLPALTHLSVTFNNSGYQNLSNTEVGQRKRRRSSFGVLSSAATLDNNNNNSNTHLVYLHLDNALNFDTRIQPILHRCPELQYLLITSDVSRFTLSNPPSNNIHVVFNLCPRVHHIIFNVHVDPEEKLAEKWLLQSQKNPNNSNATVDNGTDNDRKKKKIIIDRRRRQQQQLEQQQQPGTVRQLLYRGEDQEELNAIFPILEKSRLWLEDLHLESWEARLTGFLAMAHAHFYFPQLVSLEIFGIDMTGPEWVQILQSHPQIESLGMELWFDELEELDNVVEAISTLKRLQRIDLYWTNNYSGYRGTCSKLDLLHNTELQIVNLSGIPLSDQGLLHVCQLPRLQQLGLGGLNTYPKDLTEAGMIKCAEMLKKRKINFLQLTGFDSVTDAVLERLGRIDTLTLLRITYDNSITDLGVKTFLGYCSGSSSSSISSFSSDKEPRNKRRIEVSGCPLVSRGKYFVSEILL